MGLTVEPNPDVRTDRCVDGHERRATRGFVRQDGNAYAVYFASGYPERHEAWIDVVFGTWGANVVDDHVTFGCRVGPIEGQPGPACSLVDAATIFGPDPLFGEKLDRPRALAHPRLAAFWDVVDLILERDPTIRQVVCQTSGPRDY